MASAPARTDPSDEVPGVEPIDWTVIAQQLETEHPDRWGYPHPAA